MNTAAANPCRCRMGRVRTAEQIHGWENKSATCENITTDSF